MGDSKLYSEHHCLQYASSQPASTRGRIIPGLVCLAMRSGSSAAMPKYCTIFVPAPCDRALLENSGLELSTPVSPMY